VWGHTMKSTENPNILIVDDRPENLLVLEALLDSPDLNIVKATSGNEALGLMLEHDFSLILLDVQMPEMDGFETAELMRSNEKTKGIPVIFVTAISKDQKHIFRGYDSGAVDYIFKPFDPDIVKGKVKVFLELYQKRTMLERVNEELRHAIEELEESKKAIEDKNKVLSELSIRDGLTGLFNHRFMDQVMAQELSRAQRYGTDISCLLMDLDYFKEVNDTYGHAFGDFVLKEFSSRLKEHARGSDHAFRYGGEEFLLLLPQTDIIGAQIAGEKFRKVCESKPFSDGINSTDLTVSIGITSLQAHQPVDVNELIAFGDKALYRAKADGRNRVNTYHQKSPDEEDRSNKGLRYLKEGLSAIMEKTKKASMNSLELLVRDKGGTQFLKHNQRVLQYIDLIGSKLCLPPIIVDTFIRAATLHDCFKVLLGEALIGKKDALCKEERDQIEGHPYMLAELTELFDFFSNERSLLLYHHENYDGSGYPEGLKGGQIPIGARIFSIVDAMVAMTSERSYRETLSIEDVISELADNAGKQFDPMLTDIFLDLIEEKELFPVSEKGLAEAKEKVRRLKG